MFTTQILLKQSSYQPGGEKARLSVDYFPHLGLYLPFILILPEVL